MPKDYAVKSAVISIPGLVESQLARGQRVTSEIEAYARVPLVFRALRIRCNALLQIPRHYYVKDSDEEVAWPFLCDENQFWWRAQAALLLRGGNFALRLRNPAGIVKDLQWLNPFTVDVKWVKGLTPDQPGHYQFKQTVNGENFPKVGAWTQDDIIYLREFNAGDDVGPGVSAARVALQSSRLAYAIPQMAANFFENGAMPITTVSVMSAIDKDERERIENFFKRAISGMANAFRVLAVDKDLKIQQTQNRIKDMETPELRDQARKDIALAFELPVTLLDQDENRATAISHNRSFYSDTVIPAGQLIAAGMNEQALTPMGLRVELNPQEMSLFQEDESARAQSLLSLANAIATLSPAQLQAAMAILGYDVPEDVQPFLFTGPNEQEETAGDEAPTASIVRGNGHTAVKESNASLASHSHNDTGDGAAASGGPGDAQLQALERKQFRAYAAKRLKEGKPEKIKDFAFKHLSPDEKERLLREAQPGDNGAPFRGDRAALTQKYRGRLSELAHGPGD